MYTDPGIFDTEQWKKLSAQARGIFLYLAVRSDKAGQAFPSITRIAVDMRHDRKTVISALRELRQCHMVTRKHTPGLKATYTIVPVLESIPVPNKLPVVEMVPVPKELPVNEGASTVSTTGPVPFQLPEQLNIKRYIHDFSTEAEAIYSLFPSRDPNNQNRATGKCAKNKKQIEQLLKTGAPVRQAIESYLAECARTKTYLKNFTTLLNNLPEVAPPAPVQKLGDCPEYHAASKNPSMAAMAKIREEMMS